MYLLDTVLAAFFRFFSGVHDNSLDDFSTKYRRRAMPKTRAASVACEQVKPSPLSPTGKYGLFLIQMENKI